MDTVEVAISQASTASTSSLRKVSDKILFSDFTSILEEISKIPKQRAGPNSGIGKNEQKRRILQSFLDKWRSTAKTMIEQDPINKGLVDDNFFQVLRLLLPSEDRRVYNLKEAKLAALIVDALCISNTDASKKLLNYRVNNANNKDGDFAGSAYFVLKMRCHDTKKLTLHDVNTYLDRIAEGQKTGQNSVKSAITHFLSNLSAEQMKWLIRIILKDLKIGIQENFILEVYHPDALDLYNVTTSLEKICDTLRDPSKRLHEIGVSVMTPCRPMLGEKAKPSQIETLLKNSEFYIETKYDGERFQLHKSGNNFAYFSRNSNEKYSENFGQDRHTGTLTPHIYSCFSKDVKDLIIDGEMCGYDTANGQLLSKSDDFDVKSSSQNDRIQRCFCVYDILLYNDTVLTNKPLRERLKYLEKSFKVVEGRIVFSTRKLARTNKEVADALNDAIDSRLEGIVVKNPDSVYRPAIRNGSGWYKVKPDYMLGLNDDLDLLIVGGYYGEGRRSGLLSHFLLAVAYDGDNGDANKTISKGDKELDFEDESDKKDEDEEKAKVWLPKVFYSFCKIGSGYTMKELNDFNQKLKDKWKTYDKKNPPKHLQVTHEKPDMWIEPKDSLIVQVKAVEISVSEKYKAGVSLRFPRLDAFRPDKSWFECMKLSELNDLYKKNEGKLASGKHYELDFDEEGNPKYNDEDGEPIIKKKKLGNKKGILDERFRGIDASTVTKISETFKDREFCVMIEMDNEEYSKIQLEKSIIELGGELVQNPLTKTHCIIASKLTRKLQIYKQKDSHNIVKPDWLLKCIKEKRYIEWKPNDMLYTQTDTKKLIGKLYDDFGDSYMEDATIDSLKEIFKNMDSSTEIENRSQNDPGDVKEAVALIENKYFPNLSFRFGLFRMINAYLDVFEVVQDESKPLKYSSLDLIKIKLMWRGGFVHGKIKEKTTHCILDKSDLKRIDQLKRINRTREKKLHIVSKDWVEVCIDRGRLVNELEFHL